MDNQTIKYITNQMMPFTTAKLRLSKINSKTFDKLTYTDKNNLCRDLIKLTKKNLYTVKYFDSNPTNFIITKKNFIDNFNETLEKYGFEKFDILYVFVYINKETLRFNVYLKNAQKDSIFETFDFKIL